MSTQSGSRLPAWCAGLEDSMERMALSLAREVTGWTGPDTVFVPEDYGYIPGEKATAALRRAVEAAARHGGIVRQLRIRGSTVVMECGSGLIRTAVNAEFPCINHFLSAVDTKFHGFSPVFRMRHVYTYTISYFAAYWDFKIGSCR